MLKDVITDPVEYRDNYQILSDQNFAIGCILKLSAHDSTEYRKEKQNENKQGVISCLKHVTNCRLVKISISLHSVNHISLVEEL